MFCHKCGTQIAEGAAFCHKCGTKIECADAEAQTTGSNGNNDVASGSVTATTTHKDILRCPNCHSTDLIPITETRTDVSGGGYGVGKGCCGWILLGPFGLLCGLCGTGVKSRSRTLTFWVCKSCGTKFRSPSDIKADEAAESVETCASVLVGSIVLYVVGNLLSDNSISLLGLPNWIFITLGVLGIILSTIGILGASTENMNEAGEANMAARRTYLAALIASIASFIGGIIFAIAEVRFFWVPAWAYIVLGLLGATLSAIMLTVAWVLGATEDDIDALEKKYGPMLQKVISIFGGKK